MKKIRLLSLFSGIGAFEKALTNIGVDYELVNYCEIDKYASKSYSLIHNESEDKNLWDITKIDIKNLPTNIDLITHGSPCQDFSIAGTNKGGDENTGTRSSLMWNSVEIIKHCKPKYVIWENVKNVLSVKHKHNFKRYLDILESFGYKNFYKVLNAKDFGIPQNRERIFVVSVFGNEDFVFPEPKPLQKSLFDLLDEYVDIDYYISIDKFIKYNIDGIEKFDDNTVGDFRYDEGFRIRKNNLSPTLSCKVGSTSLSSNPLIINKRVYDGYINSKNTDLDESGVKEISPTLCARDYKDPKIVKFLNQGFTIRKMTPNECWKLMGFETEDVELCQNNGISKTQLYKQAGNSIVVPVLEEIFKKLFIQDNYILECNLLESIDYDYNESGIIFKDYALDLLEYEIKDLKCKKLNDHYIERHTLCEVLNRKFIVEWLDGIGEHENIYEKIYEIL